MHSYTRRGRVSIFKDSLKDADAKSLSDLQHRERIAAVCLRHFAAELFNFSTVHPLNDAFYVRNLM